MERTGLISYFEVVMSAEHVKKYKPSKEVYLWATKKMNVPAEETLMVSAHGWDIAGAINAGMMTAFVKQPGQMIYLLAPEPNIVCINVADLAQQLDKSF